MEKVVFNFGFILEEKLSQEIIQFSEKVCASQEAVYRLSKNSLPHITVLQFEDFLEKAETLWSLLQNIPTKTTLDIRGLVLDRWRNWDVLWLKVKRPQWLFDLQWEAMKQLPSYSFVNGTAENFEPHITVGAWESKRKWEGIDIPETLINRSEGEVTLTLGRSGPNFQYEQVLYK